MKEHFVNYNQALALKELGFDEPCMGKYDTKQGDEWLLNIYSGHLNAQFSDKNKACIAPLKSQAFRWFREKHDKYGVVNIDLANNLKDKIFVYMVEDKLGYIIDRSEEYNTYEEAESACIDKLIEIVKAK